MAEAEIADIARDLFPYRAPGDAACIAKAFVNAFAARGLVLVPAPGSAEGAAGLERATRALIDADPSFSGHHEAHMEVFRPRALAAIYAYLGIDAPAQEGDDG